MTEFQEQHREGWLETSAVGALNVIMTSLRSVLIVLTWLILLFWLQFLKGPR